MAEDSQPAAHRPEAAAPATAAAADIKPLEVAVEDESDPDFDDLDDVLDQFSAATSSQAKSQPQSQPTPSSSGPGRPPTTASEPAGLPPDFPVPSGPRPGESEEVFMDRLSGEIASIMSKLSAESSSGDAHTNDIARIGQELDDLTERMEASGIKPEHMLSAILGEEAGGRVLDVAEKERDRRESESQARSRSPEKSRGETSSPASSKSRSKIGAQNTSFEDTIRETMARMESSSAAASNATAQSSSKSEEDMLAEMLRALESESGEGGEGDLSKMFLGMMEQLTNKDMLYEPMKELATKYPGWLEAHKPPKLDNAEYERFSRQRGVVDQIVAKFEEPTFSDEDPKCREFIWDKMQAMQGEGAPPEDLIENPFPGAGGMPGLGEGPDEGCPTQ